jgi:flavin reductase (DIM6/NTAB) family NADH-FMN oxidoreductase RutF
MGCFATGVTVVTASVRGETRGITVNAFMSGSLEPPLCVVSVRVTASIHRHLLDAGAFGVSILSAAQQDLASHFGGRPIQGLEVTVEPVGGIPTLSGACAWITADLAATHPCGDHTLLVGRIQQLGATGAQPLLYHAGRYATLEPGLASALRPAPDLS